MALEDLDIVGPWPDLAGKSLERMLAQESWFDGECDDEANVVWFQIDGDWHKLYFDGDAVFWRASARGPEGGDADAGDGTEFKLTDLMAKFGLAGGQIAGCDGDYLDEASEIILHLAGSQSVTFRNRFDRTSVTLASKAS